MTYTIKELADEFNVSYRTIRFYGDMRLISPQRKGTVRIFSEADRESLKLVVAGRAVGLSLPTLRLVLNADTALGRWELLRHYACKHVSETIAALEQAKIELEKIDTQTEAMKC